RAFAAGRHSVLRLVRGVFDVVTGFLEVLFEAHGPPSDRSTELSAPPNAGHEPLLDRSLLRAWARAGTPRNAIRATRKPNGKFAIDRVIERAEKNRDDRT